MISRHARWVGAGAIASALMWVAAPAMACPMGQGNQHMHRGGMAMMHQGGGGMAMHAQHGQGGGGMGCKHGQGGGHVCPYAGGTASTETQPGDQAESAVTEPNAAVSHDH
jgi:hypothetical protein